MDFGDRYVKVMPLGAAGMGEVWEGRDTRLGRSGTIKVVRPGRPDDRTAGHGSIGAPGAMPRSR
ncbi:hypothetical protein, partial [Actinomadura sp. 7K507]|uniref:hypothetical protein n=1 Tax=Actinomadura sp. 7K507 TaxID=2530365 RepID=UPI0010DBF661